MARMARKKIVVVNNDEVYVQLLATLLEDADFDAVVRRNPDDGYEAILEAKPDLVILDLAFVDPQATWTVLSLMRLDERTKNIPAILTATDEKFLREKEETLKRHKSDWIAKPFAFDELLGKIQNLLGAS